MYLSNACTLANQVTNLQQAQPEVCRHESHCSYKLPHWEHQCPSQEWEWQWVWSSELQQAAQPSGFHCESPLMWLGVLPWCWAGIHESAAGSWKSEVSLFLLLCLDDSLLETEGAISQQIFITDVEISEPSRQALTTPFHSVTHKGTLITHKGTPHFR